MESDINKNNTLGTLTNHIMTNHIILALNVFFIVVLLIAPAMAETDENQNNPANQSGFGSYFNNSTPAAMEDPDTLSETDAENFSTIEPAAGNQIENKPVLEDPNYYIHGRTDLLPSPEAFEGEKLVLPESR